MQEGENVEVLFLGTVSHESESQSTAAEKSAYQDEIVFADPVQVELLRIPNNGKQLYCRINSQTQKQPIKSLEIYYRNLDKKMARYSMLFCSSSELLVSSSASTDIFVALRETIYTDLLVIRGNFTNITLCIYGRVLRSQDDIDKKCPYFHRNIDVPMLEDQSTIKIDRDIFDESRTMARAIDDEYRHNAEPTVQSNKADSWGGYSNDRELYDTQIGNVTKVAEQLSVFQDMEAYDQIVIKDIRLKLETIKGHFQKLFKSARIGLYYPPSYKSSGISEVIPVNIVKIATRLIKDTLSDQHRALEVLKLILQLGPHAQYFVKLGGIEALINLFLKFFSSDLVILSSLKSLTIQVFMVLSFWEFSVRKMVDRLPVAAQSAKEASSEDEESEENENEPANQKEKSSSPSKERSRQKKKKKSQMSPQKEESRDKKKSKKDKKSKKNRDRSKDKKKDRNRSKSKSRKKQKDQKAKEKSKEREKTAEKEKPQKQVKPPTNQTKIQSEEKNLKTEIQQCTSFYEILFKVMRYEKNYKIQHLLRLLIQQITQTLTRNSELSNQMAMYTPMMRDTKYMFSQGSEMINSKSLKIFASFQPFLNNEQSRSVHSPFVCQGEKIKNLSKHGISPKLFRLIDSALTILHSKNEDQTPVVLDEEFLTLVSALIENNKNGVAIGLSNFIDVIKIETLLGLKKQEAIVAIICEYIHEVFLEDEGMNHIFYLDQIHNTMLKIIGWLREDKTFSLQIKRKVQYLINSVLIYNYLSGTQNNFKSFSEYFTKLIGHEHLDINKVVEYVRREYSKTVNPVSYANLSENYSLGNFYDVLPAQPLLQVDICLKMFIAILKLNRNIWTMFYEFKFVPAFATLYLKIHSLLKFFLSPSLERHNAIIEIKMFERQINNYLQVAKHLTQIFICKLRYECAFNEFVEEEDIFDTVELYEKWADTYFFLYYAINSQDSLLGEHKTYDRIKDIFTNMVEMFDAILKGYEITKNLDRQRNIKSLFRFLYRQHYQGVVFRPGILSFIKMLVHLAGPNTTEVIKSALLDKNVRALHEKNDILLPDNEKSMFENILKRNMYRSDPLIVQNLAGLILELTRKQQTKQEVFEILQNLLDHHKEDIEQAHENSLSIEKNTLYANLLANVNGPMNQKIELQVLRLLKIALSMKSNSADNCDKFAFNKARLTNAYLSFFRTAVIHNITFSQSLLQQYLKLVPALLVLPSTAQGPQVRVQQLKGTFIIVETLIAACSNYQFQSIILFGDYLQNPDKPACEINLDRILLYFREAKQKEIMDEAEAVLVKQIGISSVYLLCRLTSLDGVEFYSTKTRKNALNYLISANKQTNLAEVAVFMQETAPKEFLNTLRNYLDFPLVEKTQAISPEIEGEASQKQVNKTPASLFSKGVFTMISQNDPIGKTRIQLILDRWAGGDTAGDLFKVNSPPDYQAIATEHILRLDRNIYNSVKDFHWQTYQGIHTEKKVNNLFHFKIRKIYTQEAKKNAVSANSTTFMKNVPSQIKKPEVVQKDPYQSRMNNSPSINRNANPNAQSQNVSPNPPKTQYQPQQSQPQQGSHHRMSSSLNREPSPYEMKPGAMPQKSYSNSSAPSYTAPAFSNTAPQYYPPKSNPNAYNPPPPVPKSYPSNPYEPVPNYDSRTGYDSRAGYYPPSNYPSQGSPQGYVSGTPHGGYMGRQVGPNPAMNPYAQYPGLYPQMGQQPQVRQLEEEMFKEAVEILIFIKQNPGSPGNEQLKAKLNKLFQAPGVHQRVVSYFNDFKRA